MGRKESNQTNKTYFISRYFSGRNVKLLLSVSYTIYIRQLFILYFQLALRFHPDKNQGNDEATEKVSHILLKF